MRLICINSDFSDYPVWMREIVQFPREMQSYTMKDQLVSNGRVYVSVKELPNIKFQMNKHFILGK